MRALIRPVVRVLAVVGWRFWSGPTAGVRGRRSRRSRSWPRAWSPGAAAADVARRHEIGTGQLYTWRRQMVGVQSAALAQPGLRFARVELNPAPVPSDRGSVSAALAVSPPPRTEGLIEIVLPGGVSLCVDAHVSSRALRRVLGALEGR